MLEIIIPSLGHFSFKHIVFDFNGTLGLNGVLTEPIRLRLIELSKKIEIHVISSDTYGTLSEQFELLPVQVAILSADKGTYEKGNYIKTLGSDTCIAVGNGSNDCKMLKEAILSIAVIGHEGLSLKALRDADLIFTSIEDVFDSLENPMRLAATLRE
jgi:soluble P-type ATPase